MGYPAEPPPPPPPPAVFALFELLKLLGLILAFGIASLWENTFGYLFKYLGAKLNVSIFHAHPFAFIAHTLDYASSRVSDFFGHLALARESGFVTYLTWTNRVTRSQADEIAAGTRDTAATLAYQQQIFVPWFVSTKTAPVAKTATSAVTTAKAATKAVAKTEAQTKAVATTATHTAKVVSKAQVATIPQSIAHVNKRVGTLERWEKSAQRDLHKLRWAIPFAGVAALGAAILTKLGLNWIRCPQNKSFGKHLCGKPDWFLKAVLSALTFAVATEGIVPYAKQLQSGITDAEKFARKFWHVSAVGQGGDRALGSSTLD